MKPVCPSNLHRTSAAWHRTSLCDDLRMARRTGGAMNSGTVCSLHLFPGPVSPWQVTAPSSSRAGVKGTNKSSNHQRCQRVADSDSLTPARSSALCCNRRTVNPRESAEHRTCASFCSRLDMMIRISSQRMRTATRKHYSRLS